VQCIGAFAAERPETRIELYETVLSGTDDMLLARSVDFAVTSSLPQGFIGDVLDPGARGVRRRAVAPAAPPRPAGNARRPAPPPPCGDPRFGHPARSLGGWLNEQRWTVSHKATSIHALSLGYGYAWLPDEWIRGELERGELAPVPLREGAERAGPL